MGKGPVPEFGLVGRTISGASKARPGDRSRGFPISQTRMDLAVLRYTHVNEQTHFVSFTCLRARFTRSRAPVPPSSLDPTKNSKLKTEIELRVLSSLMCDFQFTSFQRRIHGRSIRECRNQIQATVMKLQMSLVT